MTSSTLTIDPIAGFRGELRVPSDKSLTHRAYLFAALAHGESEVLRPLRGEDCENTLRCLNVLGLRHEWRDEETIRLIPTDTWQQPHQDLDCGNSGTTMRLLAGLVASRPLQVRMVGDASLSRRPMKRIAEPLRQMGATVEGDTPPLQIRGGALCPIDYRSPVASAQVKSCVLLAGLGTEGRTSVEEPSLSRDHTERMLSALGVSLDREGLRVSVQGRQQPRGFRFEVPADISAAAFFMVAAAASPGGRVVLRDLNVNPSRTGVLDVLRATGAQVILGDERTELGEPVADVEVAHLQLRPFIVEGDLVPRLIDEIPVLAVLATQCDGTSVFRDARELRVKESDRIECVAEALRAMGARVETFEDGMAVEGPVRLRGATVDCVGDHRIGMAFAVAGLFAEGRTTITNAEAIATSYPDFERDLRSLCHE